MSTVSWFHRLKVPAALVLLLVWSLGLRVWLALPELTENRFWDERYGVGNLTGLLQDGELRPANGYHPGLSYLPAAALLAGSLGLERLTGRRIFAVFDGEGSLTATGYLLCRLLQALAGTLSIYLTFWIGRRYASPAVGLSAALLLAVVPWHLRQSVIFKPDILLVAACLLAFAASLWAAERPGGWRFLTAGAAIGLAFGTKFNAGPIALPLACAALAEGGWRDARRWRYLALGGGTAIAVFLLSTPFLLLDPHLYIGNFSTTLRNYAQKGERLSGGSHLVVLERGMGALLSDSFYGGLLGAVGLFGLLLAGVLRPRAGETNRGRRLGPRMALVYVAGYAAFYCLSTTNPSDHNWLPLAPFVALSAAWVLLWVWDGWAARSSFLKQPAVVALVLAFAVALLVQPSHAYVYECAVPRTEDLARDFLKEHLQPLGERVVFCESGEDDPPLHLRDGPNHALVREVERLDTIAPEVLDRADAELFPAARLLGSGGRFYRLRLGAGSRIVRFEPAVFRSRGEALVVVLHPWRDTDGAAPLALSLSPASSAALRLSAALPREMQADNVVSLEMGGLPYASTEWIEQILVEKGTREPALEVWLSRRRRISTDRFQAPPAGARITVVLAQPLPPGVDPRLELHRWQSGPRLRDHSLGISGANARP